MEPKHALDQKKVVAIAYDGLCFFEMGVVVEIFGLSRPELGVPWYDFQICAGESGSLRTEGGLALTTSAGFEALETAGTIVVPGWRSVAERPPEPLLDALRRAHGRGARILSVCSGVFVLAAAGLLDGRRATTHWRYAGELRRQYPSIEVDADVLYVDEGSVLTSAGSAAGLDLCLYVVRQDYGTQVANLVARRLVVPPHRDGGQAQFIPAPVEEQRPGRLAHLQDWVRERLDEPLTLETLASRAAMSPRTLSRRFRDATGTTPLRWLTRERVARAQELLESTTVSMDDVARKSGFASAQLLRLHFRRLTGTTPTAYRRGFRGSI